MVTKLKNVCTREEIGRWSPGQTGADIANFLFQFGITYFSPKANYQQMTKYRHTHTHTYVYITYGDLSNKGDNFVKGFVVPFSSLHTVLCRSRLTVSLSTLGRAYLQGIEGKGKTSWPNPPTWASSDFASKCSTPHSKRRSDRYKSTLFLVF